MVIAWTLLAVGVAVLVGALVVVGRYGVVTDRDVDWLSGDPATPADEAAVYRRYLVRLRGHQLVGGAFGTCVAVVVGVRWYGTVTIGVGGGNPLGDVLLCTVSGVALGALSAESFRLAQPRRRVASLEPRAALPRSGVARAAVAIAVTSLLAALVLLVLGAGAQPLAAAVIGCAAVLVCQLTRGAVVARARPLLSDRAAHVDARMRAFAGESVAWLQLSAAILTAAWVLSGIENGGPLIAVAASGGLVAAIVLLRRASPGPARSWRPEVAG